VSITLTAAANAAAQQLMVIDSGGALSTQQITDALGMANRLLASWAQEQNLALSTLLSEQNNAGAVMIDQQKSTTAPLVLAYTLAGGVYVAPVYTAGTYTPGTVPQFPDATTPLTLPAGYERATVLGLAIEMAPAFGVAARPELINDYREARAAASPMPGRIPVPGASAASDAPAPPGA